MDDVIRVVRRRLLRWYKKYQRDLPWRHTRDPYTILVSEIMLQQTQVERVIPKYHAFLRAFPTVKVLANAKTADVIRMWKGLGYNRRALFLQRAAKVVCDEFSGVFPDTLKELITLPGVGDYTARAVMSFAFEKKVPMMDTNHRRFYTRVYYGIKDVSDKDLLITAEEVFSKCRAYDWNQALMDFGSTICLTRVPKCGICPLQEHCKAYPKILTSKVFKKKKKK
ncbi:MAG: A/G-specific adenine glycosylase, partial [Candidatus Magasanikbacteria bacterium]|nr:A/G-specific adenine glycosylase [Candidatus Magasanikbacteria bacterium]